MFRKKNQPLLDCDPPNGIFVRDPNGIAWYIGNGLRFQIDEIPLSTWGIDPVPCTASMLKLIEPAPQKLGFRSGTLIKDFVSGTIYLVSGSQIRRITDPRVYEALGGDKKVLLIPSEYLKLHKEGPDIANC